MITTQLTTLEALSRLRELLNGPGLPTPSDMATIVTVLALAKDEDAAISKYAYDHLQTRVEQAWTFVTAAVESDLVRPALLTIMAKEAQKKAATPTITLPDDAMECTHCNGNGRHFEGHEYPQVCDRCGGDGWMYRREDEPDTANVRPPSPSGRSLREVSIDPEATTEERIWARWCEYRSRFTRLGSVGLCTYFSINLDLNPGDRVAVMVTGLVIDEEQFEHRDGGDTPAFWGYLTHIGPDREGGVVSLFNPRL